MATAVIYIVGLCPNEAAYNDLMFSNKDGWSIQNKVISKLPKNTPNLITRWDDINLLTKMNTSFAVNDLCIVGFSFGGNKAIETCSHLNRPIKKLILIDPVDYNNDDHINTVGFLVPSNVLDAQCWYRGAKVSPFSGRISSIVVPQDGQHKVQNILYPTDGKDPMADHGKYVWSIDTLNAIKAAL